MTGLTSSRRASISLDAEVAHARARRLQETADLFSSQFQGHGYAAITPEPTIPSQDRTVLFTNSAVMPFKPLIRAPHRLPEGGGWVVQPCLRAHNLDKAFTDQFYAEWLLAFDMLGAIVPADRLPELCEHIVGFLRSTGLHDGGAYRVSSDDADLVRAGESTGLSLDPDSRKASYYRWTFGDAALSGRGSTFAAPNREAGALRDLGNLIAFQRDGVTVAYGFGVGLQTVQACREGVDRGIDVTPAGSFLRTDSVDGAKLADIVAFVGRLVAAGVTPRAHGRGHVARNAAKAGQALAARTGLSLAELVDWVHAASAADGNPLPEGSAERFFGTSSDGPDPRELHLSFAVGKDIDEAQLLEVLADAWPEEVTVLDARVVDRYAGPSVPTGKASVTVAVQIVPADRPVVQEDLRRAGARVAHLGATLRGPSAR